MKFSHFILDQFIYTFENIIIPRRSLVANAYEQSIHRSRTNPKFPYIPYLSTNVVTRLIYRQLGAANCPYTYMYIHFNNPSLEQVGVGCSRF